MRKTPGFEKDTMIIQDQALDAVRGSRQRQTALGLLPFLFCVQIVAAVVFVEALKENVDFTQYFTGRLMVPPGLPSQLYDVQK